MTTRTEAAQTSRVLADGARAAARVGAGIFLSRLLGFVRDRVFAHYFGTGIHADAWRAALRMPNVLQNLLGEGTLSASLIPVYADFLERGSERDAGRFAGAALGILAVVAGLVALAGVLLAPWVVPLFFPTWHGEKLLVTVGLVRVLFPMAGILVISAWALAVLNAHRRFFISYVAPVAWNGVMIVTLLTFGAYFSLAGRDLVLALAWGALVGGVLQFAVQLPFVVHHLRGFRLSLGRGVSGVGEAVASFVPVMLGRGVVNLSGYLDLILAGFLIDGAVAVMGYAQTLYVLPISLFGMSVAASELPELARTRHQEAAILSDRVSQGLRRIAFFLVPSVIGYVVLGDVVVAAIFETGAFGQSQSLVTWGVLAAYSLGLAASASSRLLSSAFYALRDTRTPAWIAALRVVVSALVGVALMFPLDRIGFAGLRLGAAGLALGASAASWLEYGLLRRALRRAIGAHGPRVSPVARMALAASVAAAAGGSVQMLAPPAHPLVVALETLLPFGVIYLAVAHFTGVGVSLRRGSS